MCETATDFQLRDLRNWFKRDACFDVQVGVVTVHPDEHDLLELGPRPAVDLLPKLVPSQESAWIRRRAAHPHGEGE